MDLYEAIQGRRDIRHFRSGPIPDDVLRRILGAAHSAGSVGLMQPWNFLLVKSRAKRERVAAIFASENRRAATHYAGERRQLYDALKLQGILDAPLNLAVTCDRARGGAHVLGRNTVRDTDIYSTCCAIQNLWLAARAEGIGVGWVSILELEATKAALGIPPALVLVAYLCLGYPIAFPDRPSLEACGWGARLELADVVFEETWNRPASIFASARQAVPT